MGNGIYIPFNSIKKDKFEVDKYIYDENKHGKAGMWLLNYAFMNFVIQKEKKTIGKLD